MKDIVIDRRSIRSYLDKQVSEEHINLLLQAGAYAATARNMQPNRFIYVTEREILNAMAEAHPYAAMLKTATLCIIVCNETEVNPDFIPHDSASATTSILIKANELGLGSVWCALHPYEQRCKPVIDLLNIPKNITAFSLIAVGHPAEIPPRPDRFKVENIHHNKW